MEPMMIHDVESAATTLLGDTSLCEDTLTLTLGECTLGLRSNSAPLIGKLRHYFSHVATEPAAADIEVIAIERQPPELGIEFIDWKREPGKTGRKDSCYELPAGRLVRKVRTGMVFLQSETRRIAAGPCLEYDNQVINFINAQYMNWLQQRGWLICHASGLVHRDRAFGIAGFSGGGKSTLMLHLLDHEEIAYLTNDRLFIRRQDGQTRAVGIPKLPRVNPGTIVHNPRLHGLIPEAERESLLALPAGELWHLEDKYDVHMDEVYGPGRIIPEAPMTAFLILNWQRDSESRTLEINPVDLDQRRDLLGAIMKSPGPFYQYADGSFHQDTAPFDAPSYLAALQGVTIYEASGRVDFDALTGRCLDELMN